jgi:hypothetical protein
MNFVYQFPGAAISRYHGLGVLNISNYFLMVLKARSARPRCWQCPFQVSLLGLQTAYVFCFCFFTSSSPPIWVSLCCNFPFDQDTSYIGLRSV